MEKLIGKLYIFNDLHHFKNHTNIFILLYFKFIFKVIQKRITSNLRDHPTGTRGVRFV